MTSISQMPHPKARQQLAKVRCIACENATKSSDSHKTLRAINYLTHSADSTPKWAASSIVKIIQMPLTLLPNCQRTFPNQRLPQAEPPTMGWTWPTILVDRIQTTVSIEVKSCKVSLASGTTILRLPTQIVKRLWSEFSGNLMLSRVGSFSSQKSVRCHQLRWRRL